MSVILRRLYLGSLGGIFLIAFLSYYQQYPGLSSSSSSSGGGGGGGGIIPAETIFRNNFPQSWKFTKDFIDTDSLCDILCIVGVVCSCLIIQWSFVVDDEEQRRQPNSPPPPPPYGILFLILTSIYSFLRVLGGTFYSFQWDILLLETGLLTGICYAPPGLSWYILFFQQQKQTKTKKDDGDNRKKNSPTLLSSSSSLGTWPLRFLLFKLMFMSGVVKIQSQCPTWLNLTALEYHFATQPLPGPLSWHIQQVHPFLLRLSVAATFVIEIPFSFLLVAPTLFLRRFAAVMQILLQVIILLTGNYTFFNLLTIVLCIPCLENDNDDRDNNSYDSNTTTETTESRQNNRQNWSMYYWILQMSLCVILLVISCIHLFRIDKIADSDEGTLRWNVRLSWTAKECDEFIDQTIPIVVPATILFLIVTGMNRIIVRKKDHNNDTTNIRQLIGILVHLVICVWCIGVISIPLIQQLTRQLRQTGGYHGSNRFVPMYQQAQKYALTSGYGLFRRMTGVGQYDNDFDRNNNWGWAGLPPSIVARPELILEAKLSSVGNGDDDDGVWHELQFKWKPGNLTSMPKQIAPHHARLDWQMWFAALGHYQHNPWLLSLIDKLLHGCKPVIDLLMTDYDQQLLFLSPAQSSSSSSSSLTRRITEIRVSLYHYDFTRTSSEWNRRIPNVDIVSNDTWLWKFPERYWTRKFDSQYLPPLTANNPSLQDFLSHHGYNSGRTCATANEDDEHRCNGMQLAIFCRFSSFIRRNQSDQLLLCIPFVVILFGLVSRRFKTYRASMIGTTVR